jgi:hypothetical protein
VTRLSAFAASLTREMLGTYDLCETPVTTADVSANIARVQAVAEARIREFLAQAADQYAGAAMAEAWAEEDEPDAPCLEKPHGS